MDISISCNYYITRDRYCHRYVFENSPRCLFESDIDSFLQTEKESVFGILCERYHGDALTTTREGLVISSADLQ